MVSLAWASPAEGCSTTSFRHCRNQAWSCEETLTSGGGVQQPRRSRNRSAAAVGSVKAGDGAERRKDSEASPEMKDKDHVFKKAQRRLLRVCTGWPRRSPACLPTTSTYDASRALKVAFSFKIQSSA